MNAKHTKSKKRTVKDILESLKKNSPRIGFDGVLYFNICSEACTLMKKASAEFDKLIESSPPKKSKLRRYTLKEMNLLNKIREQESVAIAFAAMCLEACIWDYAACGSSQKKAKENFQSLNLVGKWVIIPKFLSGSDITKLRMGTTCILDKLGKLKKTRNDLAHPKSKPFPNTVTVKEALKAIRPKRKEISAEDAFCLIGLLLGELEKVDKTNWWFFQTDRYKNSIKKLHESYAS